MSVYEATDTDGMFKPSNPFHGDPKMDNSLLDIALENLQIITCRKGPSMYIRGSADFVYWMNGVFSCKAKVGFFNQVSQVHG